jgi:hypothetical protein
MVEVFDPINGKATGHLKCGADVSLAITSSSGYLLEISDAALDRPSIG